MKHNMDCELKRVVVDADIPYIKGVLEPYADVRYIKGNLISHTDVIDADALIVRTRTRCNKELLDGTTVKFIATATIGFDHVDMDYCAQAGITLATAAGCNARAVLQWVAAALVVDSARYGWQPRQKSLGVVGVGNVGRLIAEYGQRWGFSVVCCDPPRKRGEQQASDFISLSELTEVSDIVSFHVPLNMSGIDSTFHLADAAFFEQLPAEALVLNSSRGEVIDGNILKGAIVDGQCRCAIDTWENEPNIDGELVQMAEIATAHIAGYSAQGKAMATQMVVRALARRFSLPALDYFSPCGVHPSAPMPISWSEMCKTITNYFDIVAQSDFLTSDTSRFESIRNTYDYRNEYF